MLNCVHRFHFHSLDSPSQQSDCTTFSDALCSGGTAWYRWKTRTLFQPTICNACAMNRYVLRYVFTIYGPVGYPRRAMHMYTKVHSFVEFHVDNSLLIQKVFSFQSFASSICSLTLNCILYILPVWLECFFYPEREQLVSRSLFCVTRMFHYSNHSLACCELCGIIAFECHHFAHRNQNRKRMHKKILKSQLEKKFAGEKAAKHTLKRTPKCIFINISR